MNLQRGSYLMSTLVIMHWTEGIARRSWEDRGGNERRGGEEGRERTEGERQRIRTRGVWPTK